MAILFQNYVSGQLIPSSSQTVFERFSPWDTSRKVSIAQSEPMDFVFALNQTKKIQAEYAASDMDSRIFQLEELLRSLTSKKEQFLDLERNWGHLSISSSCSVIFDRGYEIITQAILSQRHHSDSSVLVTPVGIVGVVLPSQSCFEETCRIFSSALISGNALMVKMSPENAHHVDFWSIVLNEAKVPQGLIQIFQGNDQGFDKFLLNHPSLRSVRWTGPSQKAAEVLSQVVQFQKNFQISSYSKNAVVLLEDPTSKEAYRNFFDQVILGMGQLQSSVHRIFILESFAPQFWLQLSEYLESMKPSSGPDEANPWTPLNSYELMQRHSQLLGEIKEEHGKCLIPASPQEERGALVAPAFVQDLPNCSEKHQLDLGLPIFTVTTVKYVHEIGRWANNSYLPRYLWIFGEAEKAKRLADKLEYSHISINTWNIDGTATAGLKQGYFGDRDENPRGSFWSYVKKLTVV